MAAARQRVVGFIDMDCFYVAVEIARDASLKGLPVAVCQYETWNRSLVDLPADADRRISTGGAGLIAVSYEARALGVKRGMSAAAARKICPKLITVVVPVAGGKANLAIYKEGGQRVVRILARFASAVEKRSVDEVAIDVTEQAYALLATKATGDDNWVDEALRASHLADSDESLEMSAVTHAASRRGHAGQQQRAAVEGGVEAWDYDEYERALLCGALIVASARKTVQAELGFSCSGGVAKNKMLAKLICGLHKPDQQTLCLPRHTAHLLDMLPLDRLPGLGGDLGKRAMAQLGVSTAGALAALDRALVVKAFGDGADSLLRAARGDCDGAVQDRAVYQSFAASKTFYRDPLRCADDTTRWLESFAAELWGRLEDHRREYSRVPSHACVSATMGLGDGARAVSRSERIDLGWGGSVRDISALAGRLVRRCLQPGVVEIAVLGLTLTKFVDLPAEGKKGIAGFFGAANAPGDARRPAPAKAAPRQLGAAADDPAAAPLRRQAPQPTFQTLDGDRGGPGRPRPPQGGPGRPQALSHATQGDARPPAPLEHATARPSSLDERRPSSMDERRNIDDFTLDEMDADVLASLPPELQAEVRLHAKKPARRPRRRGPRKRSGQRVAPRKRRRQAADRDPSQTSSSQSRDPLLA